MIDIKYKTDEILLSKVKAIGNLVGNTPLQEIIHWDNKDLRIYAKIEWEQLSGSVKSRAAYNIILNAIRDGKLRTNVQLLDATSGNTGIAYATICKLLGITVTLCLPENASEERKIILKKLGVNIIFTSPFEGTDGAQQVARELSLKFPEQYFYADQYRNEFNWKAHYNSTAPEILKSLPGITHFTAGLGTTGTFTGTGKRLKEVNPDIQLIALQPDYPLHGMEGWKHLETAVVPGIYDENLADGKIEISTEEAYQTLTNIYKCLGLLISPSSAANISGAFRLAEQNKNNVVVTVLPDNADKYNEILKYLKL
jgi:cysteine synthase B